MTEHQERIAAIRERLAAATPGPWTEVRRCTSIHEGEAVYESYVSAGAQNIAYHIGRAQVTRLPQDRYTKERSFDAQFIANAPSDLAFLLAQLDAAQADTRRLDWLGTDLNIEEIDTHDEDEMPVEFCVASWPEPSPLYPTLREAIDAAMQSAGVSPEATEGPHDT